MKAPPVPPVEFAETTARQRKDPRHPMDGSQSRPLSLTLSGERR
jgi:hypothetical protein